MTERGFAKMHKKRIVSLAVILLCLSIMGTGTLAYFTDSTTAHNVITTGNIDIELQETQLQDGKEVAYNQEVFGVMPGTDVSKIVRVSNEGNNDAWVRVAVTKQITLADGTPCAEDPNLIIRYNLGTAPEQWTYMQDEGYYYYNSILKAGQETTPLFKDVLFDQKMGNEYQNSTAQVYVYAQATQVDNNGKTVFEAQGWPQAE